MAEARLSLALLALITATACVAPTEPQPAPPAPVVEPPRTSVGGAGMDPALGMVQNLARSADHTTLVGAFRAAGFAERQSGAVTLFAPTNDAFARLPKGTMEALMAPESRRVLANLLNYHIVPGGRTRADIEADARSRGGEVAYRTLQGGWIRVSVAGDGMTVTDFHGNRSTVTTADIRHSDGVSHVVDAVLLPAS